MRVVFAGGGTAGHIIPALAIADAMKATFPSAEILFCGGEHGLERELVTHAGYPFRGFCMEGLKRSLSLQNIRALYRALHTKSIAKEMMGTFSPDLVVGTGGYVCWPILEAATAVGIPTALHESNAILGFAAKTLLKKTDLVLVNYPETIAQCKGAKKVQSVGNPIRADFSKYPKHVAKARLNQPQNSKLILSFGGSLGSEVINKTILELMENFCTIDSKIFHVHITGKKNYDSFLGDPRTKTLIKHPRISVFDYLHDLPLYLSAADIAICRAGAMTLSELALTETPAILIPSPNVTGDHQSKNAEVFEKANAGIILREDTLSSTTLSEAVRKILFDQNTYACMQRALRKLAKPAANREIVSLLCQLLAKKQ